MASWQVKLSVKSTGEVMEVLGSGVSMVWQYFPEDLKILVLKDHKLTLDFLHHQ